MEAVFYLVIALSVAGLVLWQRIKDGVIIKFGLILISIGFMGAASLLFDGHVDVQPALYLIGWGAVACMLGILIRGFCTGGRCRRFEDWYEQQSGAKQ
jgi:hypothetical protein